MEKAANVRSSNQTKTSCLLPGRRMARQVAFQTSRASAEAPPACMLSTLDLATGEINLISNERWGNCYRMEWLRDGSGIAMIGTKEGEANSSRRDQVYFISYPEGHSRRLTTEGSRHEPDSLGCHGRRRDPRSSFQSIIPDMGNGRKR